MTRAGVTGKCSLLLIEIYGVRGRAPLADSDLLVEYKMAAAFFLYLLHLLFLWKK